MTAQRRAALGFKVHTGWTAVVAVSGPPPEVVGKARLQIAWTFEEGAVFHGAQELPLAQARTRLQQAEVRFVKLARVELAKFVAQLDAKIVSAAVVWGNPKPLPPLENILKSHPLVHAAEAELYRRVFAEAAEEVLGVAPLRVPKSELTGLSAARLAAMGKAAGRPWTVDQKEAALAAWVALRGK